MLTKIDLGEAADILSSNAVLIITVLFIIFMTLRGRRRGLVRLISGIASVLITFPVMKIAMPYVFVYISETPQIREILGDWTEELIKSVMTLDSSSPVYGLLGLEHLTDMAAETLTLWIVRILCYILLFFGVSIGVSIILAVLNKLTLLPGVREINRYCGAALGLCESILYIWIIMLVVTVTSTTEFSAGILDSIERSSFLSWLYENNLIAYILGSVNVYH